MCILTHTMKHKILVLRNNYNYKQLHFNSSIFKGFPSDECKFAILNFFSVATSTGKMD